MRNLTIMFIPDGSHAKTKQLDIPRGLVRTIVVGSLVLTTVFGYLIFDYIELRHIRSSFKRLAAENEGLKGEARLLMENLEDAKHSLGRVQDYTHKLNDITQLTVKRVSKRTGLNSLSQEELKQAPESPIMEDHGDEDSQVSDQNLPVGITMDKLVFRPVFDTLYDISSRANNQAVEMQHILSNLSKQKSLLSAIPSIIPVNGWVTSGYGYRISPFTRERTLHKGIDVASPIGTPIYAPASGVVIFTGSKVGFGNFIMIAHGYGVVTRFGHNAENMVQPGQIVQRGEQIGTVGMSGRTTGPHVHYEVLVNSANVNPNKFILDMSEDVLNMSDSMIMSH